jgi:hypothetical protein
MAPVPEQLQPVSNQLEAFLTLDGLEKISEQIGKIITEPLGRELITRVDSGPANWKKSIELADIVFGPETRTLDQENKKPWEYRIKVSADGREKEMNARMVGQITKQLVSFAQLSRLIKSGQYTAEEEQMLINDALKSVRFHFETSLWKQSRKESLVSDGRSVKAVCESAGVTFAPGLDSASADELVHILQAIKNRADMSLNIEENNRLVKERVLLRQ